MSEDDIKAKLRPFCQPNRESEIREKSVQSLVTEEICPPWYLESTAVLGRCLPFNIDPSDDIKVSTVLVRAANTNQAVDVTKGVLSAALNRLSVFLSLRQFGERVFSDLKDTYWMIGLALIGACLLSFIWIILMRFLTGFMVWGSILLVFLGTGGALGYCGYRLYFAYIDEDPVAQTTLLEVCIESYC